MRMAHLVDGVGRDGLAVDTGDGVRARWSDDPKYPGELLPLLREGDDALERAAAALADSAPVDIETVAFEPPITQPGKILCAGLNFHDHISETGLEEPTVPEFFGRFSTSLIGHGAPLLRPRESDQLDFEGELAVIIGQRSRRLQPSDALACVAGYSVFNDGTARDYQFRTPQWTLGKNFDDTGAFGPVFVTADELPPGGRGLRLTTRLNGKIVQDASLDDMIFGVAELLAALTAAMTLEPGDVVICGTPSGVGFARTPPIFMAPGDVCEVEIEGIGLLRNTIAQD
jgi:acylpyruvate hydrolase